ncbi:MAG: hypothetical protein HY652_00145 [Acidobacteria bacterium]|nr:hypothetical protein [Acidobacteriota bacterium]
MNGKKTSAALALALILTGLCGLRFSVSAEPPAVDYLKPKAPLVPKITSVDQLMSNVRHIIERNVPRDQRAGYNIKGGEKVLMIMYSHYDPMIVEAFIKGFKEKNCTVDVITLDYPPRTPEGRVKQMRALLNQKGKIRGKDTWIRRAAKEYDAAVGQDFTGDELSDPIVRFGHEFQWPNRYVLADPGVKFPNDLNKAIDRKIWEVIRQAAKVHLTDPQGTDVRFTWFPEQWLLVEGDYPGMEPSPGFANHIFGPGASENPIIPGHIMAYPRGGEIPEADLEGIVVGSYGDGGTLSEPIKLSYKRSEIQNIDGGSEYGRAWLENLQLTDDIKFPHYPRPGTRWLTEISIGTNPKIRGPVDAPELRADPYYWKHVPQHEGYVRDRTGVIHVGHGARSSQNWADVRGFQVNHFHVHIYFSTYEVQTRDGRTVKILDNGHATVLEDPEIRQMASKYGNADEILSEDWIPYLDSKTNIVEPPKGKVVSWDEFVKSLPAALR